MDGLPLTRRTWQAAALLFLLALILRVGWLMRPDGTPTLTRPDPVAYGDEADYHSLACEILAGQGYNQILPNQGLRQVKVGPPTAFRTPGFPGILAALYMVSGKSPLAARIVLVAATSATASLVLLLSLLLGAPLRVGVIAGAAWALSPVSVRMSGWLVGEESATLLLVLALVVMLVAFRKRARGLALLSGALLGYSMLVRGFVLFVPLVMAGWLISKGRRQLAILFLVGCSVLPGLWIARNLARIGTFGLSSEAPEVLWLGNNRWARGSWPPNWTEQHADLLTRHSDFDQMDEAGQARVFREEAIRDITGHPGHVAWLLPRKLVIFFWPRSWLGTDWPLALALPFFLLGSTAVFKRGPNRQAVVFVALAIGAILVVSLVAYGDVRHRHPALPLIFVMAALGLEPVLVKASSWLRPRGALDAGA